MFFSKIVAALVAAVVLVVGVAALVAAAALGAGVAHWHHHDAQHDTGFKAYSEHNPPLDGIAA